MKTERIKLGSGAHLLPFHHPAELAHRVAYLDHLSQGRFLFGVGSSGLPVTGLCLTLTATTVSTGR